MLIIYSLGLLLNILHRSGIYKRLSSSGGANEVFSIEMFSGDPQIDVQISKFQIQISQISIRRWKPNDEISVLKKCLCTQ